MFNCKSKVFTIFSRKSLINCPFSSTIARHNKNFKQFFLGFMVVAGEPIGNKSFFFIIKKEGLHCIFLETCFKAYPQNIPIVKFSKSEAHFEHTILVTDGEPEILTCPGNLPSEPRES